MNLSPTEIDELLATAQRNGLSYTVRGCGTLPVLTSVASADNRTPNEEPEPFFKLLPDVFDGSHVWVIGVETRSETNQRDWKKRSARTQAARRAVSRCLGRNLLELSLFANHYHRGGNLRVKLTRFATRKLDVSNLGAALKAVEDAVALMLGADDGDDRWQVEFSQEVIPGRMGVRVELECMERRNGTK